MFMRSRLRFLSVPLGVALLAAWGGISAADSDKAGQEEAVPVDVLEQSAPPVITDSMLINAGKNPENWILYGKHYQPTRYSQITGIDAGTINSLQLKWVWLAETLDSQGSQTLTFNEDLYVNSAKGQFFRVDGRTGRTVWKYNYQVSDKIPSPFWDAFSLHPVLYDDKIYVTSLNGHVLGLDSGNGKVVWDPTEDVDKDSDNSILSSLATSRDQQVWSQEAPDGHIYSIDDGKLQAIDAGNGKTVWTYSENLVPLLGGIMVTGGGLVFAGDAEGHLRAFDAINGKQVWSYYTGASYIGDINALEVDGRELITVLTRNENRGDNYMMAFELR